MPQDPRFIPDEDPRFTSDADPTSVNISLSSRDQPPEQKTALRGFWDKITDPVIDIRRQSPELYEGTERVAEEHPFIGKPINFALDFASQMTSPFDLLMGAATGGASLGRGALQNVARKAIRGGSGLMMGVGAERMIDAESLPELGAGALEVGLGGLGVRGFRPRGTTPKLNVVNKPQLISPTNIPDEVLPAYQKLSTALDEAVDLNKVQKEIYTAEKGERIKRAGDVKIEGLEDFHRAKGQLAGEYTKVGTQPIQLGQEDVDSLVVHLSKAFDDKFKFFHAADGLERLLKGQVPQPSQVNLLKEALGPELGDKIIRNLTKIDRKQNLALEAINFSRAIKSSLDMSAPMRQGLPFILRREWWTSLDDMVRAWGSEEFFNKLQDSIVKNPNYGLAQESGLQLTDLVNLRNREEAFMSTWAEKIPSIASAVRKLFGKGELKPGLLSKGVRASNRAYVSFLNKLRMDTFDSLLKDLDRVGINPRENLKETKAITSFINDATGRGSLGKLERHAELGNILFYSPRFISSRVRMWNRFFNPYTYAMTNPVVRKEQLRSLLGVASAWGTIGGVGKMAGADISLDPRSSDFSKVRIGNFRLDPGGGFQQYLVAATRLAIGESTSPTTGRTTTLGEGFGRDTRKDVLERFTTNKLNPPIKFAYDLLNANSTSPIPFDTKDRIVDLVVPMIVQDIQELIEEDPSLLPLAPLPFLGVGSQRFGD